MTHSFEKYNDILLDAFKGNQRSQELANKKLSILQDLIDSQNLEVQSILFLGFSPSMLNMNIPMSISYVSQDVRDYLDSCNVKYNYIDPVNLTNHKSDVTVAFDEFLTFADSDSEQKRLVELLCRITNHCIITTLRDYKNQDFKDREFSQPLVIRDDHTKKIYFEHYEYTASDRNSYTGTNYIIVDDGVIVIGPFERRNMFFKQLAKFGLDSGASNFLIHKNLMHKSIVKKSYEHIITIKL
jgi:hypothetical protein